MTLEQKLITDLSRELLDWLQDKAQQLEADCEEKREVLQKLQQLVGGKVGICGRCQGSGGQSAHREFIQCPDCGGNGVV